jgi:serine protease Do
MISMDTLRRQKHLLLILSTLTVGILIGTVLTSRWGHASAQSGAADATPLVIPPLTTLGNEFTQLAKKLEDSVVAIRVEVPAPAATTAGTPFGDGEIPDIFRRFLPGPQNPDDEDTDAPPARRSIRVASGTGFIVDKNGYILTNNHVVENATKIIVTLQNDSTQYRARFIGADYESDLAVIKIDARKPLKPVTIANSDSVQVGDWAVAIGSPFGLASTVTVGIVSALGRGPDQLGPEARAFQNFIQTDAAINPGNSGGPLLNIRGEVIGINTMIETATGGSNGVGFAVPINMGVRVYNDIIRDGQVTRGSIGVSLSGPARPELVLRAFKLDHGAIIEDVRPGGPAAKGGMKPGDIVLAINGKPVKDNQDLISTVADLPVGREATFRVDRDGELKELKLTIANRAELYAGDERIVGSSKKPPAATEVKPASSEIRFGFRVRGPVTEQEKDLVPSRRGIVVASVEEDSFAADVGLRENDIVESINRQPVNSVEDINRIRSGLKPGDAVAFRVYRPIPAPPRGARGKNQPMASAGATGVYLAGILPER